MKKNLLFKLIAFGLGLIGLAVMLIVKLPAAEGQLASLKVWCDAFTMPGLILLAIGLILYIIKDGFFDGVGYAIYTQRSAKKDEAEKKYKTYADYKQRENKPKYANPCLLPAAVFLVVAIILNIVFAVNMP